MSVIKRTNRILREREAASKAAQHLTAQQEKSHNHITFLAGMEYFTRIDGNDKHQLYRANENNPVQRDGYRAGARWQCPEHLINDYLFLLGLPATWRRS